VQSGPVRPCLRTLRRPVTRLVFTSMRTRIWERTPRSSRSRHGRRR
jgi:hypothetical protein